MSKRSFHVRDESVRMDVDISLSEPVNGVSEYIFDIFLKVLNEDILDRSSLGPGYQPTLTISLSGCDLALSEYIGDLSQDPRLNQMSKTFFARYTGSMGGEGCNFAASYQVSLEYVPRVDVSTPGVVSQLIGQIQP